MKRCVALYLFRWKNQKKKVKNKNLRWWKWKNGKNPLLREANAQSLIIFKTYTFSMEKIKQQKAFSRGNLGLSFFREIFTDKNMNIECWIIYNTYSCNKSCTPWNCLRNLSWDRWTTRKIFLPPHFHVAFFSRLVELNLSA